MSDYRFTKDWFNWAPPVWEQLTPHLPARQAFLEIGSFEGRSMLWIVENMMEDGGFIDCIDTWEGGEEHTHEDMGSVEDRFDWNAKTAQEVHPSRSVHKTKGLSTYKLAAKIHNGSEYDFIYIDGSHTASDVLTDACMAWQLLKQGGVMVFDDYLWGNPRDALHRPKMAIDAFVNMFGEHLDIMHVGYQMAVKKK